MVEEIWGAQTTASLLNLYQQKVPQSLEILVIKSKNLSGSSKCIGTLFWLQLSDLKLDAHLPPTTHTSEEKEIRCTSPSYNPHFRREGN